MLEKLFKLKEMGTDVKTEVLAGLSTFLTMAYIIAVNPGILSATGMPFDAVFVATCIAAAFGSAVMGLWANYPVALAPGMGLNAFFTFGVVLGMGQSWEIALGCVFWSGILFILLSVFKVREWIINAIPSSLKTSISVGIGLFLALIAMQSSGIIVNNDAVLVGLGDVSSPSVLLTFLGLAIIVALHQRQILGSVVIGMAVVTIIGAFIGLVHFPEGGLVKAPSGLSATLFKFDPIGALEAGLFAVIFAFLFVDLFDTSGTLVAVADKGGLMDKDGKLPRLGRALMADSSASVVGSLLGTSTTTSYIESGAGIASGGRTGLTAVTVAVLFLLALFFSPVAQMIPVFATSAALLYVAVLMVSSFAKIHWDDMTEAAPAVITAVMMPLTYSIAEGIAIGFISYAVIKLISGKGKDVNISVYVIAALAVLKFIWL
ncbi:NCS2 family permease [Reinekea marinisedimentorum]|uniref:AGZA family xanthine/uracil permease-like MFS transporter n=1 Tax=Reinekea marinisedimentorum TaxID=230495 RepID=A0A4R3I4K9_9GAMM|nr:NCS2 family permease [Reinekea marinisedimentorum]TCS40166.1 AGZA family xanthine/uracil permease-like MFS transporter [Reinekea marinisedimentorum]